jgi:glycosyltransferase involved in cell wall biosynthesis
VKLLIVTQGYFPAIGGTELLVQRVSEELVGRYADEVTVFTTNCFSGDAFYTPQLPRMPVGEETINGVRVRRFPVYSRLSRMFWPFRPTHKKQRCPGNQVFRTLYNGPVIPGLARAIEQADFEVVMATSFPLLHMFTTLKIARKLGRPCVFQGGLHPQDEWGFQRPMIYQAIQRADHYIANTTYEADYVIARGAHPDRVSVAGVGVDMRLFEAVDPIASKQRYGLEGSPVVGYIGQLGAHKGVDTLARAMPLVWKLVPEARFLIAGARTLFSDQLEQMLAAFPETDQRKVILRYNFENDEKPALFSAVDVFAYPSGYESFGIAFLEAWAVKKPVIGCSRGAVPWVVEAGKDGLLVEFQDEAMLAEAILALLNNPGWSKRLGEAGYSKVKERYQWPEIARRYRSVYSGLQKMSFSHE